jgi:methyl-accepting chemotaxis protein
MQTLTIRQRIIAGFFITLLPLVVTCIYELWQLHSLSREVNFMITDATPGTLVIMDLQTSLKKNASLVSRHLAARDKTSWEEQIGASAKNTSELIQAYEATITLPIDRQMFDEFKARHAEATACSERALAASREGRVAEAQEIEAAELCLIESKVDEIIGRLVEFNRHNLVTAGRQAQEPLRRLEALVTGGLIVGLLASMASVFFISQSTTKVLTRITGQLADGSAQVAAAATQVSSSSQTLASGASQQAASLEETSASLEEISSMTKRNAESADQAKQLANQTRSAAETGAGDVQAMNVAMDAIKSSSDNIAKIIKTIDEIAFQTNILALNAAVEAARAGEAGAGFAVVAEEVRALAQRSAQAAKETAEKIEDSIGKSEHGVGISAKVAQSLEEIVEKARKVDGLVAEIAQASQEQSQGIGQVLNAVTEMDRITQANAASAEESASAAEELNAQAKAVDEAVNELQRLVGGLRAAGRPAAEPASPAPRKPTLEAPRRLTPAGVPGNGRAKAEAFFP